MFRWYPGNHNNRPRSHHNRQWLPRYPIHQLWGSSVAKGFAELPGPDTTIVESGRVQSNHRSFRLSRRLEHPVHHWKPPAPFV